MLEIERDDIKVKGDGENLEIKWVTTFIYIYVNKNIKIHICLKEMRFLLPKDTSHIKYRR